MAFPKKPISNDLHLDLGASWSTSSIGGYSERWFGGGTQSGGSRAEFVGMADDGVLLRPGADQTATAWFEIAAMHPEHVVSAIEFELSAKSGVPTGHAWRVVDGARVEELPCTVEKGDQSDTYWLRLTEES